MPMVDIQQEPLSLSAANQPQVCVFPLSLINWKLDYMSMLCHALCRVMLRCYYTAVHNLRYVCVSSKIIPYWTETLKLHVLVCFSGPCCRWFPASGSCTSPIHQLSTPVHQRTVLNYTYMSCLCSFQSIPDQPCPASGVCVCIYPVYQWTGTLDNMSCLCAFQSPVVIQPQVRVTVSTHLK